MDWTYVASTSILFHRISALQNISAFSSRYSYEHTGSAWFYIVVMVAAQLCFFLLVAVTYFVALSCIHRRRQHVRTRNASIQLTALDLRLSEEPTLRYELATQTENQSVSNPRTAASTFRKLSHQRSQSSQASTGVECVEHAHSTEIQSPVNNCNVRSVKNQTNSEHKEGIAMVDNEIYAGSLDSPQFSLNLSVHEIPEVILITDDIITQCSTVETRQQEHNAVEIQVDPGSEHDDAQDAGHKAHSKLVGIGGSESDLLDSNVDSKDKHGSWTPLKYPEEEAIVRSTYLIQQPEFFHDTTGHKAIFEQHDMQSTENNRIDEGLVSSAEKNPGIDPSEIFVSGDTIVATSSALQNTETQAHHSEAFAGFRLSYISITSDESDLTPTLSSLRTHHNDSPYSYDSKDSLRHNGMDWKYGGLYTQRRVSVGSTSTKDSQVSSTTEASSDGRHSYSIEWTTPIYSARSPRNELEPFVEVHGSKINHHKNAYASRKASPLVSTSDAEGEISTLASDNAGDIFSAEGGKGMRNSL